MKKIISLFSALAILMSVCGLYSFAADKKIKTLKIVSQPTKTVFYKDSDWVYGTWDASESNPKDITLKSSKKISFTHNPCGGIYPERGMIDMTGLKLEITYTDGSKETITYTETKNKTGFYSANILASPKDGKEYFIGTNTIEVYLARDKTKYDSYNITIKDEKAPTTAASGDVNGDKKVNSQDALLVQQHAVGLITLTADQKKRADMNSDGKYNSTDALMILKKAVK